MKIEAGKYYRTRDGQKVGPMRYDPDHRLSGYYWTQTGGAAWRYDGLFSANGEPGERDLIAEWTDAPDLTAIKNPFGLLDRETQEALKAHGGPYEVFTQFGWGFWGGGTPCWPEERAIRVKPAPPKPRNVWVIEGAGLASPLRWNVAEAERDAADLRRGGFPNAKAVRFTEQLTE
jgi:hypothetical protein